jgi:hypothetical protein
MTGGSHREATTHAPGQEVVSLTTGTRTSVSEELMPFLWAHEMRSGPAGRHVIVPEKTGSSWAGAGLREMGHGWKFGLDVSWCPFFFFFI